MNKQSKILIIPLIILFLSSISFSQVEERKKSLVVKNDGTEYIGTILKQDAREVLLLTDKLGEIYIPKHEIKSITELRNEDYYGEHYLGENIFATRYFLTTNGLPMKKGDSYAMIQLFGAEYQAAVIDNLTIGGLTSWIGVPVIGSAKYAINISDNFHAAVGILAGSGSWAALDSYGVLPFGALTLGNNKYNVNISAGYLTLGIGGSNESAGIYSIAGQARITEKVSLVGDSFIFTPDDIVAIIVPGLRFERTKGRAFQFGLAGLAINGSIQPFPIPVLSWFVKI